MVEDGGIQAGVGVEAADVGGVALGGEGSVALVDHGLEGGLAVEEAGEVADHPLVVDGAALEVLDLGADGVGDLDAAGGQEVEAGADAGAEAEGGEVGKLVGGEPAAVEEGVGVDVEDGQAGGVDHG
jgi:hypothetical protein